jgi:hypothetical protein
MKFTFKRTQTDAIDWKTELPRFRAARAEHEGLFGDAADMAEIDNEISRRAASISLAAGCSLAQAYERFLMAAKTDGTEEQELLAAHFKAVADLVHARR